MSVFYNFTKGIAITIVFCCFSMTTFSQTFSSAPGASLPDNSCTPNHEFPLEVSMVTPGYLLSEVAIDITHTWDSDLDIALIAPDGTVVRLSDDNGGSANNYTDTHFSDTAATAITSGSAPFTGTYRPEEPLSTVSAQGDGTWILRACDDAGGDLGTLNWWSLTFSPPPVQASIEQDCLTAYNGYCAEISVSATDGVPPYTYLWSDGSDTATISACPTENTVYSVTVTDASGVTSTDEVMVVYVPQDISCGNNKVQICHVDGKGRGRTICVATAAVPAHLAHGDSLGSCEETYYTCSTAPSCAMITSPMDGAVDVTMPVTVEWSAALGLVDGYLVSVGTTMGGTDILDNAEGGMDLMHTINGLEFETTYYVSVTAYNGNGMAEGCEGISFTTQTNPCNLAPAIGCNETATGSTVGNLVFNVGTCGTSLNTAPGVWYAFTGTGDIVTVDTNGSSFDTKLGVFTGGCDAPVCLDGDDDGGDGLQSLVNFTSEEGVEYLFYVTGFSSNAGNYVLNVTCEEPATAVEITCGTPYNETYCYTANDTTTFAYTNNGSGPLTIEFNAGYVENSNWDHLRIYDGTDANGTLLWENGTTTITNLDGTVATAASGNIFMTINSDSSVQCVGSSSATRTWDFDLYCGEPPFEGIVVDCGTAYNNVYCYANNDLIDWQFASSNGNPITLSFVSGILEESSFSGNTYDDLFIYDGLNSSGTLLYNSNDGVSGNNNLAGMSWTATSGYMYVLFDADGSVSCASGSACCSAGWEFNVTCASGKTTTSSSVYTKDDAIGEVIDWSMAPNPTRGNVTLNLSNYLRNHVTVEVIDFTGKVISSESVRDLQTARYTLELNNSLPSGMYFVRVATDSQVSSKKLVIMR